jgi:hypothetical protein
MRIRDLSDHRHEDKTILPKLYVILPKFAKNLHMEIAYLGDINMNVLTVRIRANNLSFNAFKNSLISGSAPTASDISAIALIARVQ